MPIAPTHAESEDHQKKHKKNYVTGYQEFFFMVKLWVAGVKEHQETPWGTFPRYQT